MPDPESNFTGQTTQPAEPIQATPAATPSAPAAPAASTAATTTSQSASAGASSLSSAPSVSGTPATPTASAEQQYATVRDTLRNYGLDLTGQFQDDHSLLQHLAGAYRQRAELQQLAQYGQTYLQHADRFNAWMREQQTAQQAQAQAAQQWWKPPEYDASWASKLTRDPATGEIKPLPGTDPAVVAKYHAWVDHQRGFLERFSQDPIKAIQPGIEQVVKQVAQQMIQQHLGGYQAETRAKQIIEQHASWMHERDSQGQAVINPVTRQPQISPWGQKYFDYVRQAEKIGIGDVDAQNEHALAMVQRDYLVQQYQQGQTAQQAAQQGNAAKTAFLQQAAGGANNPQHGANQAAGVNGAPTNPPPGSSLSSLRDLMLRNMAAAGFQPGQTLDLQR